MENGNPTAWRGTAIVEKKGAVDAQGCLGTVPIEQSAVSLGFIRIECGGEDCSLGIFDPQAANRLAPRVFGEVCARKEDVFVLVPAVDISSPESARRAALYLRVVDHGKRSFHRVHSTAVRGAAMVQNSSEYAQIAVLG